jgi:alkylhydroperoxidase family enzyme
VHGGSEDALRAIQKNDLASSSLAANEQKLLNFVQKVNGSSHKIDKADVDLLCEAGWSQLQIAEAVHVAALFATFNRVANAFGLQSQGLLALFESQGNAPLGIDAE